jgi:cell division protein FtsB
MPIDPSIIQVEIIEVLEDRFKDILVAVKEELTEQKKENQALREQITQLQQQQEHQVSTDLVPNISNAELASLKADIAQLKELFKNLKTGPDQYDLKKEFPLIAFVKSKLQLDYVSAVITGFTNWSN